VAQALLPNTAIMRIIGIYPLAGGATKYLVQTHAGHVVVNFDRVTAAIQVIPVGAQPVEARHVHDAVLCISAHLRRSGAPGPEAAS